MKRTLVLLLLLVVIGGGTLWFMKHKEQSEHKVDYDRSFQVADTASLVRIFLADRLGNKIDLKKKDNNVWWVNDSFPARLDPVNTLLTTFKKMEILYLPAKAAENNIKKEFSTQGIKVELYTREGKLKTFYVGGAPLDEKGTYMLMDGARQVYVMGMSSWIGTLRPRFFMDIYEWRTRDIFDFTADNIKSVSVDYLLFKNKSYRIDKDGNGFAVKPLYPGTMVNSKAPNQKFLENYLNQYKSIGVEGIIKDMSPGQIAKVSKATPVMTIKYQTATDSNTLRFYPFRWVKDDPDDVDLTYDPNDFLKKNIERLLTVDDKNNYYISQYGVLEKILWRYDAFFEGALVQ